MGRLNSNVFSELRLFRHNVRALDGLLGPLPDIRCGSFNTRRQEGTGLFDKSISANVQYAQQSCFAIVPSNELTIDEIATFMKNQFDPTHYIIRERFKFWSNMLWKPGETVQELAARIRQDAVTCDFASIKTKHCALVLFDQSTMKLF